MQPFPKKHEKFYEDLTRRSKPLEES